MTASAGLPRSYRVPQPPGMMGRGAGLPRAYARAPRAVPCGLSALGQSGSQVVMSSTSIAGSAATGLISTGAIWATAPVWAVPVIGAAVAAVTVALALIFSRKGPKQKVATTEIVNKVEPSLKANLAAYLAGPRTQSSQAQALENFRAGWAYVVEYCDTPAMGDPGKACVKDRSPGGQWDWWSYYYNPIANDTQVRPDSDVISTISTDVSTAVSSLVQYPAGSTSVMQASVAGIPVTLLLAGAAVALALTMGGKS